MNTSLKPHLRLWFILGLAAAALLTLAFQGGETDPAHCHACKTPTHTPTFTPTPTSTPAVLPTCRISEIYFNEQLYQPGSIFTAPLDSPLEITLRLVDDEGQILIGADINAAVTPTETVQAAAIPPLEDQSGTYDAPYTPENTGLHLFQFSASDPSGTRFLSCSAEALVEFVDDGPQPPCEITIDPLKERYLPNEPITVTARVFVDDAERCDAEVSGNIRQIPDGSPASIPFPDSCPYTGIFPGTSITGTYTVTVAAQDRNSGQDFTQCASPELTLTVDETSTPTPTSIVSIELEEPEIDLCGRTNPDTASSIVARDVSNLAQVDLSITYDSTFIIPDEITPVFGSGPISRNGNTIRYQASSSSPVSGTIELLDIDWRLQGRRGTTTITLTSTLRDNTGASIPHTDQNGTLVITISPPCLRCTANLQGRADHSGVMVTSYTGEQAQSYPNGLFAIAATGELSLAAPGYLSAQMAASAGLAAEEPEIDACQVNLLAGDTNGDNTVNILDLTYLAGHYQSADPTADLNASGLVDILDLTLAAGNYQRQGQ